MHARMHACTHARMQTHREIYFRMELGTVEFALRTFNAHHVPLRPRRRPEAGCYFRDGIAVREERRLILFEALYRKSASEMTRFQQGSEPNAEGKSSAVVCVVHAVEQVTPSRAPTARSIPFGPLSRAWRGYSVLFFV